MSRLVQGNSGAGQHGEAVDVQTEGPLTSRSSEADSPRFASGEARRKPDRVDVTGRLPPTTRRRRLPEALSVLKRQQ